MYTGVGLLQSDKHCSHACVTRIQRRTLCTRPLSPSFRTHAGPDTAPRPSSKARRASVSASYGVTGLSGGVPQRVPQATPAPAPRPAEFSSARTAGCWSSPSASATHSAGMGGGVIMGREGFGGPSGSNNNPNYFTVDALGPEPPSLARARAAREQRTTSSSAAAAASTQSAGAGAGAGLVVGADGLGGGAGGGMGVGSMLLQQQQAQAVSSRPGVAKLVSTLLAGPKPWSEKVCMCERVRACVRVGGGGGCNHDEVWACVLG